MKEKIRDGDHRISYLKNLTNNFVKLKRSFLRNDVPCISIAYKISQNISNGYFFFLFHQITLKSESPLPRFSFMRIVIHIGYYHLLLKPDAKFHENRARIILPAESLECA